ncbi:MAG: TVP38/TMEM64 family protein, partial [Clostridia bacterium]|nr:TVP38/TMEM64 family protein [Clostridia bacterium]
MKRLFDKKRLLAAVLIAGVALLSVVIYVWIGKPLVDFVRDPERLREWVEHYGWKSRVVYGAIVCLQVILAVVPGEPLELSAGYAFGALEGSIICLAGIFVGSVAVFLLVKRFGVRLVRLFFSEEKIAEMRFLHDRDKVFLFTGILMILPGTPKDLLTYFAGLTDIPFGAWLLVCSAGRIPSIITSTWGGSAIATGDYGTAAAIFAVTALLSLGGLMLYRRLQIRRKKRK